MTSHSNLHPQLKQTATPFPPGYTSYMDRLADMHARRTGDSPFTHPLASTHASDEPSSAPRTTTIDPAVWKIEPGLKKMWREYQNAQGFGLRPESPTW